MKKYPTLTFRLDSKLLKRVQREAKRTQTSVGNVIKTALKQQFGNSD